MDENNKYVNQLLKKQIIKTQLKNIKENHSSNKIRLIKTSFKIFKFLRNLKFK